MRSRWGQRGLTLIMWGLAVHIVVIALLYGAAGVGEGTLRILAAWKEALAVALLLYVCARVPLGLGPGVRIGATDMLVGSLLGLAAVFFVGSITLLGAGPHPPAQLLGIRDAVFFFALYFVGRATPEIVDDPATVKRMITIGVVTSLIAVVEIAFIKPDLLAAVGIGAYFNDFLNIEETTANNEYGLPDNYWSTIGGHLVRRAGSTYLTSQGFAIPFLIILAAGTWRVFASDRRPRAGTLTAYVVLWGGLLLSITRMTVLACGAQIIATLALRRRAGAIIAIFAAGVFAITTAAVTVPPIASFIWQTISGQSGSNQSHAKDLANGIDAVLERPWGWGLGTADQTALRNGLTPLTFDNMYLKYGTELGVLGMGLFVGALATILVTAKRLAVEGDTPERRTLGGIVFLATIGIFINGLTSNVFNSPWLAYVYCWLAGAVVTSTQRLRATHPVAVAESPVVYA